MNMHFDDSDFRRSYSNQECCNPPSHTPTISALNPNASSAPLVRPLIISPPPVKQRR